MYIGIEVIPRLFCSAFSFSPVTNAFGKTYLTSKLLVSEKVTNSDGLMMILFYNSSTEPAFTCLKSPVETPAECVKSVES